MNQLQHCTAWTLTPHLVHTLCYCISHGCHGKQRLVPHTVLTGSFWYLLAQCSLSCTTWNLYSLAEFPSRAMAQAVSRWCHRWSPGSITDRSMPVLWSPKPGLDHRPLHASFMVDKVALEQIVLQVLRFSPVSNIPPMSHTRLHLNTVLTKEQSG